MQQTLQNILKRNQTSVYTSLDFWWCICHLLPKMYGVHCAVYEKGFTFFRQKKTNHNKIWMHCKKKKKKSPDWLLLKTIVCCCACVHSSTCQRPANWRHVCSVWLEACDSSLVSGGEIVPGLRVPELSLKGFVRKKNKNITRRKKVALSGNQHSHWAVLLSLPGCLQMCGFIWGLLYVWLCRRQTMKYCHYHQVGVWRYTQLTRRDDTRYWMHKNETRFSHSF